MNDQQYPQYRLESVPPPPDTLSGGAALEWQAIVPIIFELRTARPADLRMLELLCEILADCRSLEETIRAEGYTIEAGSGGRKAHPGLQTLTAARRQAQTLLDRFDLGPSGMQAKKFEPGPHKYKYG